MSEIQILDWIQEYLRCPLGDAVMSAASYSMSLGLLWFAIAIILILKGKNRFGWEIILAIVICTLICDVILKNIFARPRPFIENPDVVLAIAQPSGYSFPSGHAMKSFAVAMVIFMNCRKMAIYAFVYAAIVSFSRLYLYVHYPTDVLIGILIGLACAYLIHRYYESFEKCGKRIAALGR